MNVVHLGSCLIILILRSIRYGAWIRDLGSIGLLLSLLLTCIGMMYRVLCTFRSTPSMKITLLFVAVLVGLFGFSAVVFDTTSNAAVAADAAAASCGVGSDLHRSTFNFQFYSSRRMIKSVWGSLHWRGFGEFGFVVFEAFDAFATVVYGVLLDAFLSFVSVLFQ